MKKKTSYEKEIKVFKNYIPLRKYIDDNRNISHNIDINRTSQ